MKFLKKELSLAIFFFVTSLSADSKNLAIPKTVQSYSIPTSIELRTHATWYAGHCVGRILAGGKRYTIGAMFVATNNPYPFGTKLKITNLYNHRSVVVSVEDREPYHPGRALDLSYAAAQELDIIKAGVVPVSYQTVKIP